MPLGANLPPTEVGHLATTYDGYNLKISTNGGAAWETVTTVAPAYATADLDGEPAWGGNQSSQGWQLFTADLGAYVGQPVLLRFAFRSDSSVNYAGIYLDDIIVTR